MIAENLSEEEIAGLKELFKMIDTDGSGQITFEELKAGLKRFGANLNESQIYDLMHAVSITNYIFLCQKLYFFLLFLVCYLTVVYVLGIYFTNKTGSDSKSNS